MNKPYDIGHKLETFEYLCQFPQETTLSRLEFRNSSQYDSWLGYGHQRHYVDVKAVRFIQNCVSEFAFIPLT